LDRRYSECASEELILVRDDRWWLVALRLTGSLNWLFASLAFGLIVYGVTLTVAVRSGAWFDRD
jgi:hypothetical protein